MCVCVYIYTHTLYIYITQQHLHDASVTGLQELSAEAQSLLEGTPMSLTVDGDGASIESNF